MGQWANAPAAVGDLITAFENAHHALADQIHTILDAIGFAPAADAHGNAGPAHGEWLDHFLLR
jgi:hypothetical protein